MVYIIPNEYTDMVAVPTQYYFSIIVRGYFYNGINFELLQILYSECLSELRNLESKK
ncbi:hypothetical protein [Clostridium saccharobutylicum]|uniref:Uncharacterized protein n=1 Tax=Clostridium saccharobutylicum DSM 13864 TaxID=1345695 RepID=U5MQE3_CLOSA|nr:hypothetical protein [Clostridium saccharobutylicum]AGX42748.1 hypothetical protein CLSA_c17540 [Clostridium saccharobutylicum DSM 13864]MBA2904660.1 hypothetical protein [Clostridium saccharobutylicum]MBA8895929.1 hypothetical protein [Clostridium saccharobutylicum]MBA8981068.1 hypothetical protein [Clostridium saccharobutylicum]MBA8999343.1 hypothetical protein [Clostridium saccharobutylicum]